MTDRVRDGLAEMYVAGVDVRRCLSQDDRKELMAAWKCGYDARKLTPSLPHDSPSTGNTKRKS